MKSSSISRWPWKAWMVLLIGAWTAPALAADLEAGFRCLEQVHVPCARRIVDAALEEGDDSPSARLLTARTAFYEGKYQEALDHLASVEPHVSAESQAFKDQLVLYEETVQATADFSEKSRGSVTVRYAPGVDVILVDEALDTLEAAVEKVAPVLGGAPEQPLILEIYPTVDRFVGASGLGEEAVKTTGVVALSKWSRLLMTSPRALMRGYPWKDTIVHEYIHLVVAYRSSDRTPVWLQEGIARHLEGWWRHPASEPLGPFDQALLAQALARDDLVTFEEMHPSLAFLPSAERAQLAFGQVKVFVEFAIARGGADTLTHTLSALEGGEDARQALAAAAGYSDFDAFNADALAYVRKLDLVERRLAALPVALQGEENDYADDPLLGQRKDLAEFARLGDLLREAGRPRAALAEYAKAMPADLPSSPMLSNLVARCWMDLKDQARALSILRASEGDYPDFALTHKTIGSLESGQGRTQAAISSYLLAADINPYDSEVQSALATLFQARGNTAQAERHERYHRILRTGGGLETP